MYESDGKIKVGIPLPGVKPEAVSGERPAALGHV